ncbi:FAD-dependent oxidoreductase [Candidatus Lucifugimonas marina]|uniref:FAD-dependent oxidoreductase n=1 Tax=Candidatus Lucifugimonas marina TaxID=3038979 RepID=UPI00319EBBF0
MPKTVAVVGGGIFGVSAALKLAEAGATVTLFDRLPDLLNAASGINQYRLHRGYHYPRSKSTAAECLTTQDSFLSYYDQAVIDDFEHYYCISKRGSLTSAEAFVTFCEELDLEYRTDNQDFIRPDTIELCVRVKESLIDIDLLRALCHRKLAEADVQVLLNTPVNISMLRAFDNIVVAAYAGIDSVLETSALVSPDYQFELCEKPVVRLPASLSHRSVVVLDGPFMCFDPLGRSGNSVMGNVTHAIHTTNVGPKPVYPAHYDDVLNKGLISVPAVSNYELFIESAKEYFPAIAKASYIGSQFTIRTVLPHKEKTDERLTNVTRMDERIISVFAGKLGTSMQAADQLCDMVFE